MAKKTKKGEKEAKARGGGNEGGASDEPSPEEVLAKVQDKQLKEMKARSTKAFRKNREMAEHMAEMDEKNKRELKRLVGERDRKIKEVDRLNTRLREALDSVRELKRGNASEVARAVAAARKEEQQKAKEILNASAKIKKELDQLSQFKDKRESLAKELETAKMDLKLERKRHAEMIRQIERKFVLVRERMQREMESRIKLYKTECRQTIAKELDVEAHKLRMINQQMSDEIRFHVQKNNELRTSSEKMRARIKQMKMDVDLAKDKDIMQANKSVKLQDQLRREKEKYKELENTHHSTKQRLAEARQEFQDYKRRDTSSADIAQLRHHLAMKTNEVNRIKKLAKRILEQRGDVERFFLSALEQVKHEIRQKRDREAKRAKKAYTRHLVSLAGGRKPSLPKMGAAGSASAAPNRRVDLADLEPEDRERVLRLLFSKINTAAQEPKPMLTSPVEIDTKHVVFSTPPLSHHFFPNQNTQRHRHAHHRKM